MSTMGILGIGFAGADIIQDNINNENEKIMPGGTCGNVLSALASMNWDASLIKSRYCDELNDIVDCMWRSVGINVILCGNSMLPMPRVVEVVDRDSTIQYSSCPVCKKKLTEIKIPTSSNLKKLSLSLENYDLLFCDRINEGIKYLVNIFRRNNRWLFYEPNSVRNYQAWLNNVILFDVIKFSSERISEKLCYKLIADLNKQPHNVKVIIMTHGELGYSYSMLKDNRMTELKKIPTESYWEIVDPMGAGDWLTAGFIDKLLENYKSPLEEMDEEVIVQSLAYGSKLSKEACSYVGALGKLFIGQNIQMDSRRQICGLCKLDN